MSVSSSKAENTKERLSQISRVRGLYTEIVAENSKIYECKVCSKRINGNCSSNLIKHIKNQHDAIYRKQVVPDNEEHIEIQRLKMVHSCAELVTINSHPFSLLTQSGFKSAIQSTLRKFQLAGCGLNLSDHHVYEIKEKIRETAEKIKDKIKFEVEGKLISVMVDAAKRNGRAIFGISIQYKYEGVLKVVTIGMCELKDSYTADYLADVLVAVLAKYGITLAQVLSITTDNGANMIAMVKEIGDQLLSDVILMPQTMDNR